MLSELISGSAFYFPSRAEVIARFLTRFINLLLAQL